MHLPPALIQRISDLRTAVSEELRAAVDEGRFADVAYLGALADAITRLPLPGEAAIEPTGGNMNGSSARAEGAAETDSGAEGAKETRVKYPYFVQDQGAVVKVGWSPKSNDEYRHRVDTVALEQIARAITVSAEQGVRFKISDLSQQLATNQGDDGEPIPSYQVHAALAWFKHSGIVIQHGRRGYSLANRRNFMREMKTALSVLPEAAETETHVPSGGD